MNFEIYLAIAGLLLLLCVFANKVSDKYGVPSLLLFLGFGMLTGSDGIGGIHFQDSHLTSYIGNIALMFILFSGGLETKWSFIRPIIIRGAILSTLGVFLTAVFLYIFTYYVVGLPFNIALLLSVIVSSTDAPAVFSLLSSRNMRLNDDLKSILEFESGSNDPMAVFLSLSALSYLTTPNISLVSFFSIFLLQMSLGILMGLIFGHSGALLLKKWSLPYQGLYPVYGLGIVLISFSLTQLMGGNGFLAVYLSGIVMGNTSFNYRRQFIKFNDSLAWIMQIGMFLILGLLVNPRELGTVMLASLSCTMLLMFIARPLAVYISLLGSKFNNREKILISWSGLKGAVPIILATYPLTHGFPNSQYLFNLIFFLVIISVILQGQSLPWLTRKLKLEKSD